MTRGSSEEEGLECPGASCWEGGEEEERGEGSGPVCDKTSGRPRQTVIYIPFTIVPDSEPKFCLSHYHSWRREEEASIHDWRNGQYMPCCADWT